MMEQRLLLPCCCALLCVALPGFVLRCVALHCSTTRAPCTSCHCIATLLPAHSCDAAFALHAALQATRGVRARACSCVLACGSSDHACLRVALRRLLTRALWQTVREKILNGFRSGRIPVLIATDVPPLLNPAFLNPQPSNPPFPSSQPFPRSSRPRAWLACVHTRCARSGCGTRPRHRPHRPRRALRRAQGGRDVHPSRRPHWPRRPHGHIPRPLR